MADILGFGVPRQRETTHPCALPEQRDEAVTALFVAHHRRLVGLARLLVDDQQSAEDVVQDAFGQLHRRWCGLRDKDAAVAYLQRAVVNGARSALRRRRVRRREDDVVVPDAPSAELSALRHEDHRQLRAAIAGLPQRQRQVLVLRYFLDLSEAEIAHWLDISRGSVKQHAARGLAALSARLEVTV
jgi:RNA polymerase sigma-70 factor (sigma-E family)